MTFVDGPPPPRGAQAGAGVGVSGSRLLLKRLRDVMAATISAQARLDQVVRLIAADMVAEVCSAYLMRAGEVLELFATEGLNPDAVHKTRMRVGEGIIGDVAARARPLALSDAWSYANFSYRPETGEDIYRSLMGVPILRGGRVLGVLAVQNRTTRVYTEEEVETLETIAMVLAELVASGELVDPAEAVRASVAMMVAHRLDGVRINGGLAVGEAVLHRPRVVIRQMVAENPAIELERLNLAVTGMHRALDRLLSAADLAETGAETGEFRAVLETYRMFAEDRGWLNRIREAVRGGLTADAAVQKVQNDMRARMRDVTDAYLRERLLDLEDLTNRLLVHLSGAADVDRPEMPDEAILIARSMGPAELLEYDRRKLRGLVLEDGSPTSHVAIVARALEIPVVGRVKDVLDRIDPGDDVVVDGDHAQVLARPSGSMLEGVRGSIRARADKRAGYRALRDAPAVTRDGIAIDLFINAGLLLDVAQIAEVGAGGIGLYRTEIPFMVRTSYPDVATQTSLYANVLDAAGAKPVAFRTLDIGGDKTLPYFDAGVDENPAMGWRAIRIGLDRPVMLRQQLRAMLRAAADRALQVMFPMISEVAEFDAARALVDHEIAVERAAGRPVPAVVKVGAMIEVPALLWQLPQLLARADFLSVGSNDLMQFLFAFDRGSQRMIDRYDPLSPPMLSCLKSLVSAAEAAGKPITLCGEMAGRPIEALALIGLGFRRLSMSPVSIGPVKMMIRGVDLGGLSGLLARAMAGADHSLRANLVSYARDHGIVI